jgi:hypothetical protein
MHARARRDPGRFLPNLTRSRGIRHHAFTKAGQSDARGSDGATLHPVFFCSPVTDRPTRPSMRRAHEGHRRVHRAQSSRRGRRAKWSRWGRRLPRPSTRPSQPGELCTCKRSHRRTGRFPHRTATRRRTRRRTDRFRGSRTWKHSSRLGRFLSGQIARIGRHRMWSDRTQGQLSLRERVVQE